MVNAREAPGIYQAGSFQRLVYRWQAQARRAENAWTAVLSIPLRELGMARGHEWPLRVDIGRQMPDPAGAAASIIFCGMRRIHGRRGWCEYFQSADLGWMIWK